MAKAKDDEKAKQEFIIIEHPDGRRVEVSRFAFHEFYEAAGFTEAKKVPTDGDGPTADEIATPRDAELQEEEEGA